MYSINGLRLLMVWVLLPLPSLARTWYVTPKTGIRHTLTLATSGDTLQIGPGTYREHSLIVNKPLVILGEKFPVVDAERKGEIFTVQADNVLIRGFDLRNVGITSTIDWAAVKVLEARQVRVVGNRISHCYFGVYLSASNNCLVRGNTIAGVPAAEQTTGNGIHAWKCDQIRIDNNRVSGHRDGIYFEFVTNSSIQQNTSFNNIRYGLHFMFSHQNAYIGNTFRDNGAGVAVMYTKGVTMRNNVFVHNWGSAAYGLLLKDISDSQIEQNTFQKNTIGIHMEGSNRITVRQNRFIENGWGVRVQASCVDNLFQQNQFQGNTFDVATNGNTVLNTFDQNYWDKYEGYDLNRDGLGDVPYHPVSLYSVILEQMPHGIMLLRSFMVSLLDRAEKVMPSLTPDALVDKQPVMKLKSL
ncbi:MAG: nitrous oxide reductase [Spirosoma sp. 48-14]|nr:MAG: nitrous oxide reductase [Spirosoma sp. 48-14]